MNVAFSMPRAVRIVILILALAATLGVATAAASPAHIHAKSTGGTCEICFTAHVVSYEASFAIALPAVLLAERQVFAPGAESSGYQLIFSDRSSTRGPPASSL